MCNYAQVARKTAAYSLQILRKFPRVAARVLTADDNLDQMVAAELYQLEDFENDDESVGSEVHEELGPDAPENEWVLAKTTHGVVSPSMDKLMGLVGLKDVKVFVAQKMPAHATKLDRFAASTDIVQIEYCSMYCIFYSIIVTLCCIYFILSGESDACREGSAVGTLATERLKNRYMYEFPLHWKSWLWKGEYVRTTNTNRRSRDTIGTIYK